MRNIRTYADIEAARAAGELTSAEEELIECCKEGWFCELGDGTRPDAPSDEHTVSANLLRYLITGGCDDCSVHDLGVQLKGAYVPDMLDLDYAQAKGTTALDHCHFEKKIFAQYCHFNTLSLQGSILQHGLSAQGSVIVGNVVLSNGFSAKGCIRLNSTKIGGQLSCAGAQIEVTEGDALDALHAHIIGSVFLNEGFSAKGSVILVGSTIEGQFSCDDGRFHSEKDSALNLQGARVAEFFWRQVSDFSGRLDLSGAHFGTLVNDMESWSIVKDLTLIGLTYDLFAAPGSANKRLKWLAIGDQISDSFSPQPYTQLANVLRETGHDRDARIVLVEGEIRHRRSEWKQIEKSRSERGSLQSVVKHNDTVFLERHRNEKFDSNFQKHLDRAFRICLDAAKDHPNRPSDGQLKLARVGLWQDLQWFNAKDKLRIWWLKAKSYGLNKLVGYGYKPFNSLWALVVLVLLAASLSHMTWRHGDFAPNSDVI
ncbi:hypothetical protein [Pseudophaeobacter sp.]|uniref:hypothetical protein n=1 Tax=Pseudophaeobacter sp. TaxID=1971739 RepID=UPI003299E43D